MLNDVEGLETKDLPCPTCYYMPDYKAPYRSDDTQESCELACDYFSGLVDEFLAQLPEHRLPKDFNHWLAEEHTLAEKVDLIFPKGFGEYHEERNHNPSVWPAFVGLSNAVANKTTEDFAKEICESWKNFNDDGQCKNQMQLLHRIFDWLTWYLQIFVVLSDANSSYPDFVYPPEDKLGILIGTVFRNPDFTIHWIRCPNKGWA